MRTLLRFPKRIFHLILLLVCLMALLLSRSASLASEAPSLKSERSPSTLAQQGRDLYEAGQWYDAMQVLQQAAQDYRATGDTIRQALTLSNLSLVYQQMGAWPEATQAITESLNLIQSISENPDHDSDRLLVLAQALDIQGRLFLSQGQPEEALTTWEAATAAYEQAGDKAGAIASQINQAQALQGLGLYRRAIALLSDLHQSLLLQPDSLIKATVFRNLGDALLVAGDATQARQVLEQSLSMATAVASSESPPSEAIREAIAATNLSLGNLVQTQAISALSLNGMTITEAVQQLQAPLPGNANPIEQAIERRQTQAAQAFFQDLETVMAYYQAAIRENASSPTSIQALLNQLTLLVETQQWAMAQALYPDLQTAISELPISRTSIYHQISFARSLLPLAEGGEESATSVAMNIAHLLSSAHQHAVTLGDVRAQSYALGHLGEMYEQHQQWSDAQGVTQQALHLAEAIAAPDILYRWQWQLGRLLKAQGDQQGAITAYSGAVSTLQSLRGDLVAVNRDVQFSFREGVEPVYREFVDLLLQADTPAEVSADNLVQARNVIEGLKIAELDNFFREACLDTTFELDRVIDQADLNTAIVYTIVLPDRLATILKLPNQPLHYYASNVPYDDVLITTNGLLSELRKPYVSHLTYNLAKQVHDWLILPLEPDLVENGITTLVFVLDDVLRNIPMSVLYDGEHYLLERYTLALAPGLQIADPRPLQQREFKALIAGLSEARSNFPPLTYVEEEVAQIQTDVPSEILFNQSFTEDNFQSLLNSSAFSIVHIATHGQFSSNAEETFILAWDKPIDVNELGALLRQREFNRREPVELLVLSACQTAVGDRRATLGLAGMAVRAGARSTIASLWSLDDNSGAYLMSEFYDELVQNPISKAEALRLAQLTLLNNPQYQAPRFWAPYVLLGNWL